MPVVAITTPFNISLDFETAPFHKRVFASLLDLLIMVLYSILMKFILYQLSGVSEDTLVALDVICITVPLFIYHLVMEVAFHGQSLGKRALAIRVMSVEGGDPSVSQYLLRWMLRVWEWPLVFSFVLPGVYVWLQLIYVGILGVIVVIVFAVTPKNQRLGDLAANTIVVNTKINSSIHDTIFMEVSNKNYEVLFPEVMKLSDRDINTIKTVINEMYRTKRYETAHKVSDRIKNGLKIQSDLEVDIFLERLIADYNFLATKE